MFGDRDETGTVALGLQHQNIGLAQDAGAKTMALMGQRLGARMGERGIGQIKQETHDAIVIEGHRPARFGVRTAQLAIEVGIIRCRPAPGGQRTEQPLAEGRPRRAVAITRHLGATGSDEGPRKTRHVRLAGGPHGLTAGRYGIANARDLTGPEGCHYSKSW